MVKYIEIQTIYKMGEILKLDLDKVNKEELITELKIKINFLNNCGILPKKHIEKVELIFKSKYGCKIYMKKEISSKTELILIQSILGSDWKHSAITYRDYKLNIRNFNRMFDLKVYANGETKTATVEDITKKVVQKERKEKK